ncbi:MAG: NfeD family protein [Polyangiales bacterium]
MTAPVIVAVLIVGLVLLFVEIAVVPGFGVAGVLGLLALAAGALAAWTELGPFWGTVAGVVSLVGAGAMLYVVPKSRAGKRMVLEHSQADAVSQRDRSDLVGRRGTTVTPLRPTGRVRFGKDEIDVMTEGEYIDPDREVEVTSVAGPRIVVRVPESP